MTLEMYTAVMGFLIFVYLLGIAMHGHTKSVYSDIEDHFSSSSASAAVLKQSPLSYPFFLSYVRAVVVRWMLQGFFNVIGTISIIAWFGITILRVTENNINFEDTIDIVETFGVYGLIHPMLILIAIIFLLVASIEAHYFSLWKRQSPNE